MTTSPNEEHDVTITLEEYLRLLDDSDMLNALYQNGVDNWDGYGDVLKLVKEWKMEDKAFSGPNSCAITT